MGNEKGTEVVVNNPQTPAVLQGKPADIVINQFSDLVEKGQLFFPDNYNYVNAVKYAALVITQTKGLQDCTKASVVQALSDMALQGLDVQRKQGYFIKYGNELKFFRSYFGDVAAAMQTKLIKDIKAVVIYDGDEFETGIENDEEVVLHHKTSFKNRDNEIIGAYAVAILPEGAKRYCVMTKKEIDKNWAKSTNKDNQVQKDFPQEMAKRTVIRRLVKLLFNSANTSENFTDSLVAAFNRTTENEYEQPEVVAPKKGIKTNIVVPNIADEEELEETPIDEANGEVSEEVAESNEEK